MTITEMLGQSGLLTLLGMCVVFGFIIIMIACMKLLSVIVHALKLDKEEPADTTAKTGSVPAQSQDMSIIAAIAAAVHDKQLNS